MIGVYVSDSDQTVSAGKITDNVTISVKAPTTNTEADTTKSGAKTFWTGPMIEHENNTITAGGWTKWLKNGTDLEKWLCQTGTVETTLTDDSQTIKTFLWDATSEIFRIWTFKFDEINYYEIESPILDYT